MINHRSRKVKTTLITCFILLCVLSAPTSNSTSANSFNSVNIILMIGDGMGFAHIDLARWVELGEGGIFTMEDLTVSMEVITNNSFFAITDSASAATAMACGQKTNKRYVGITPDGTPLVSILEIAQSMNKSTGLISTLYTSHSTPASFYAKVDSNYKYDEIREQELESGIDILMSEGLSFYNVSQISTIESKGYDVVYNRNELLNSNSDKIWGLFAETEFVTEMDRDYTLSPSIAEMTQKTLDVLGNDPNGFFLMVEGAQIDWSAHDSNTTSLVLETIAFIEAVDLVLEYASTHTNTLVLITADHETGGLKLIDETLNSTLPAEKTTEEEKRALRIARAEAITISYTRPDKHTAANVPLYGYGEYLRVLENHTVIDNTDIFEIMNAYYNGVPPDIPLPSPTSTAVAPIPIFSLIVLLLYKKRKSN